MCLPHSDDFKDALRVLSFWRVGLKNLSPSVNNLFGGILFSHEDKIHENVQESSLLGKRTKGNFAWCFQSILQVFERAFCRKSLISSGRNDRLKPGKLLILIEHIGDKIRQFLISLL